MPVAPKRPETDDVDFVALVQSGATAGELRQKLQAVIATDAANSLKYSEILAKIVDDMVGLLRAGRQIDVDELIANMAAAERVASEKRARGEKNFREALRLAAKKLPSVLKLLNECRSAELDSIEREAALHRDARWRLMKARTQYQPGQGVGPIRGKPTDIEDLLKS